MGVGMDGLKGFPEAIEAIYPHTEVQLSIVHLVRNSLRYVSWKDRKEVAAGLKAIYRSVTISEAEENLEKFAREWDQKYQTISEMWRRNWERIILIFAHPQEIRRVIYTTNAIESLNASLRKVTRNRGSFPTSDGAYRNSSL